MEGISIIVPCYNKLDLTKEYVSSARKLEDEMIEFIMVDNGSTDGTTDYLKELTEPFRYHCNAENVGLVQAFNQGAALGRHEILVFMHNDVIIHDHAWPVRMRDFFLHKEDIGIIGLYGARRIRRDSSFMGRSIVHAKLKDGNMGPDYIEVVIVDGLFMAMQRKVYEKVRGFDEKYIIHYYDKDISLKAYTSGYKNYIINAPFIHKGAGTRSAVKLEEDDAIRKRMKEVFLEQWEGYLPLDVRTKGERVRAWIKKYV